MKMQPASTSEHQISDNVINRSNIGQASVGNINIDMGQRQEKIQVCGYCSNPISPTNPFIVCDECDSKFCHLCENQFRHGITRQPGEPPLCKRCYRGKQQHKAINQQPQMLSQQPSSIQPQISEQRNDSQTIPVSIQSSHPSINIQTQPIQERRQETYKPIRIQKTVKVEPGEFSEIAFGKIPANMRIEGSLREKSGDPFNYLIVSEENYVKIMSNKKNIKEVNSGVDEGAYKINNIFSIPDKYFLLLGSTARSYTRSVQIDLEIQQSCTQNGTQATIEPSKPNGVQETEILKRFGTPFFNVKKQISIKEDEYEVVELDELEPNIKIQGLLRSEEGCDFDYYLLDEKNFVDYCNEEEYNYIDGGEGQSAFKIDATTETKNKHYLILENNEYEDTIKIKIDVSISKSPSEEKPSSQPPTQQPVQPHFPQQYNPQMPVPTPICYRCRQPIQWVSTFNKWYCPNCQTYL
jgi:hypothetical protein